MDARRQGKIRKERPIHVSDAFDDERLKQSGQGRRGIDGIDDSPMGMGFIGNVDQGEGIQIGGHVMCFDAGFFVEFRQGTRQGIHVGGAHDWRQEIDDGANAQYAGISDGI